MSAARSSFYKPVFHVWCCFRLSFQVLCPLNCRQPERSAARTDVVADVRQHGRVGLGSSVPESPSRPNSQTGVAWTPARTAGIGPPSSTALAIYTGRWAISANQFALVDVPARCPNTG